MGCGAVLAPLPIGRFRCPDGHGTFSKLPAFLCRYIRSLECVLRTAFEDHTRGRPLKEIPTGMGGPTFGTVIRWLSMLRCQTVGLWLEQKRQARRSGPVPENLNIVQRTWALAQRVTEDRSTRPAALIAWARLLHLTRYGSSTYRTA
jgi:hypothetical protein